MNVPFVFARGYRLRDRSTGFPRRRPEDSCREPSGTSAKSKGLNGTVVFTLAATAGQPASTSHVYLRAGNYFVRLTAADGSPSVNYLLTGRLISDPIGPRTDDGSDSRALVVPWDGSTGTTTDPNWDQPYYW